MAYKRGEGKNNADYSLRDLYKEYKAQSKNPVSYRVYSEFIKEYNDRIAKAMVYDNIEFNMPYRVGYLRIQKRKITNYIKDGNVVKKHLMVDWHKCRLKWREQYPGLSDEEIKNIPDKKIYLYHNDHTNGYSVRFYWDKRFSNAKNQTAYIYKPTRTIKEELAAFIKSSNTLEYFE